MYKRQMSLNEKQTGSRRSAAAQVIVAAAALLALAAVLVALSLIHISEPTRPY